MRGIIIAAGLLAFAVAPAHPQTPDKPVRLVLQITVDQLRADLIDRYAAGFGESGFRRLLDDGALYVNAHHRHANTETIGGHTTLSTGTDPAVHGMVANVWLDRGSGELSRPSYRDRPDTAPCYDPGPLAPCHPVHDDWR
jgi:predicted AlkP superfamily pyrophosphatase or phosphodiesterase